MSKRFQSVSLDICPKASKPFSNWLYYQEDGTRLLKLFTISNISPKLRYNYDFGCMIYTLQTLHQTGGRIPKCNPRARMGMYLVPSPRYARLVSLVVNHEKAMISPHFHVQHEKLLEAVLPTAKNMPKFSQWQQIDRSSRTGDINSWHSSRDQSLIQSFLNRNSKGYWNMKHGRTFRTTMEINRGTHSKNKNQVQ